MRLVTFKPAGGTYARAGWLEDGASGETYVVGALAALNWVRKEDRGPLALELDSGMNGLIVTPVEALYDLRDRLRGDLPEEVAYPLDQVRLSAPLPQPRTIRDFYAFEAHVKTARGRRDLEMIPEWYELPVFYFSNPNAVYGPDETIPYPRATSALDFELEMAVVIGRGGRDIPAERADEHIAGFTIMNDWSARDVQRKEMAVGLGPAKGKDFATSLGPWLLTPDELVDRRIAAGNGRGFHYRLEMRASIDGQEVSKGNLGDLYWTFAQMIEYASRDCELCPGEVLGSGTVGTGCLLELGLPWLQPGQTVALEVERLGVLQNMVATKE